jgi:hypothetical protein
MTDHSERPTSLDIGEVTAQTGEVWLGLFPKAGGYTLLETTLTLHAKPTTDESEIRRMMVAFDQPGTPLFLVKGVSSLRPGPVRTLSDETPLLIPGVSLTWTLEDRGHAYHLTAYGTIDVYKDAGALSLICSNYSLALFYGDVSQALFRDEEGFFELESLEGYLLASSPPQIIWAGDLDRDARLDLFLSYSGNWTSDDYVLFLSSFAEQGQLVKEAAWFSFYND